MTTTAESYSATPGRCRPNFIRCATRIVVIETVPAAEIEQLAVLLEHELHSDCFRSQLAEYLWEHHLEELVVSGRQELDVALKQIAAAFATLDESDRCGAAPPLLWLDVSRPLPPPMGGTA